MTSIHPVIIYDEGTTNAYDNAYLEVGKLLQIFVYMSGDQLKALSILNFLQH